MRTKPLTRDVLAKFLPNQEAIRSFETIFQQAGQFETTYALGSLLVGGADGAVVSISDVAIGNVLLSGGVGALPLYGKVGLTTHVSGVLPGANGGTGISTYTTGDLIYASGSSALSKLSDVATGNALISGGVGAAPEWGKITLTGHVSGTLPVANGGTGIATLTANRIPYGNGTGAFQSSSSFTFDGTTVTVPALTATAAITPSQTAGIVGTTTNNNANAGSFGEAVRSYQGVTNFPTSTQWGDLTSISLTAGDWDVSSVILAGANGATVVEWRTGISATSGNSSAGLTAGDNQANCLPPTATANSSMTIPCFRVSISSTTTYYLKYFADYSVATPQALGRLSARRVR